MQDNASPTHTIDIAYELHRSARELVMEGTQRRFLCEMRYGVEEQTTDADPPVKLPEPHEKKDFVPDYESILGVYKPTARQIVIYNRGISWLASRHNWHPLALVRIVKLHEWSHALHHLGSAKPTWVEDDDVDRVRVEMDNCFRKTPIDLVEQIAQLSTLLGLRRHAKIVSTLEGKASVAESEDIFFQLMSLQSKRYQLPKVVRNMDEDRLRPKLALLIRLAEQRVFIPQQELESFLT